MKFSSEGEAPGDLAMRADWPWTVQREDVALEVEVTVYREEFKSLTYHIDFPWKLGYKISSRKCGRKGS